MLFLGSERFNIPLGHNGYDCYELSAYLKVEQINFDIQFGKQCCSVMHDCRNFNNVSFESIMVILYDKSNWSQHPFVSGFCFFWDALYIYICKSKKNIIIAIVFRLSLQMIHELLINEMTCAIHNLYREVCYSFGSRKDSLPCWRHRRGPVCKPSPVSCHNARVKPVFSVMFPTKHPP